MRSARSVLTGTRNASRLRILAAPSWGCQDLMENARQAKVQSERQAEILVRRSTVGAAMAPLLAELGAFDSAKAKKATAASTGGGGNARVPKRPQLELEFVHVNSANPMYATTPREVSVVVNVYRLDLTRFGVHDVAKSLDLHHSSLADWVKHGKIDDELADRLCATLRARARKRPGSTGL